MTPKPFSHEPLECGTYLEYPYAIYEHMGAVNGYAGVPKDHLLYGVSYSEEKADFLRYMNRNTAHTREEDWGAFPILPMLTTSAKDPDDAKVSLELCIPVHGGITFSEGHDDYWWFGFDTHHANDGPEEQNATYVRSHCKKLIAELIKMSRFLKGDTDEMPEEG